MIIVALFFSIALAAQYGTLDVAVSTASVRQDYSSRANLSFSQKVSVKEFNQWLSKNGSLSSNYSNGKIISDKNFYKVTTTTKYMYGTNRTFITQLDFIHPDNFNAYAAYWQRQQELAQAERDKQDIMGALTALTAGYLLYQGGKAIVKGVGKTLENAGSNSGGGYIPSSSSGDGNSKTISKVKVEYSTYKYCDNAESAAAYKLYFISNGTTLSHPSKLTEKWSVISKDYSGKWWASCVDEGMSRWELLRNGTFEDAVKKYWKERWQSKYGEAREFEFVKEE